MKNALREIPEEWHQYCRLHTLNPSSRISPRQSGADEQLDAVLMAIGNGTRIDDHVADKIGRNRARKHRSRDRLIRERLFRFDEVATNPDAVAQRAAIDDEIAWVRSNTSSHEWHILWRLASGSTYAEVARDLGTSEGTLKSQVARCRARLRGLPRST